MVVSVMSQLVYDALMENVFNKAEPGPIVSVHDEAIILNFKKEATCKAASNFLSSKFGAQLAIGSSECRTGGFDLNIGRCGWLLDQLDAFEYQHNCPNLATQIMPSRLKLTSLSKGDNEKPVVPLPINGHTYNMGMLVLDCGNSYRARDLYDRLKLGIKYGAIRLSPLEKTLGNETETALRNGALSSDTLVSGGVAKYYEPIDYLSSRLIIKGLDAGAGYTGGIFAALEGMGLAEAKGVRMALTRQNVRDAIKHRVGEGNGKGSAPATGIAAESVETQGPVVNTAVEAAVS